MLFVISRMDKSSAKPSFATWPQSKPVLDTSKNIAMPSLRCFEQRLILLGSQFCREVSVAAGLGANALQRLTNLACFVHSRCRDPVVLPQFRREVSVAAELVVEVRDLGSASKHAGALAADLSEAVAKTRFLGRAEVPLAATLSATSGESRRAFCSACKCRSGRCSCVIPGICPCCIECQQVT